MKSKSEFILHLKNSANAFVLNLTVDYTKFNLLNCMYFPNKDEIILSFDSVFLQTERDVSVRQRAVDLLYAMCDRSNAQQIVAEMLNYLETADYSIREEIVSYWCFSCLFHSWIWYHKSFIDWDAA